MMIVLLAVAVQETARRRRKQQKQQFFQTTKNSDDLEIGTLTPPPGPTPIPFFGNLLSLRKYDECPYQGFSELKEKYGPVYALKMGSTPSVVVNTFDTIKEVLINKANSFDARPDLLRFKLYFGGDRQHCEYLIAPILAPLFTLDFVIMSSATILRSQAPFTNQAGISSHSLFRFLRCTSMPLPC